MKVPKNPSGDSPAEKDKTITRRTVKGAAGGMKGVDYEDDRRADPNVVTSTAAAASRARALLRDSKALETAMPLPKNDDAERAKGVVIDDPSQLTREDEFAATEAAKKRKRQKHVARDRMAVDKDAPELIRKRKWEIGEESDSPEEAEDSEERERREPEADVLEFDSLGQLAIGGARPRLRLPAGEARPEPGDPRLTDPDEIHRALQAPLAYAKHVMILGEAFRRATGASRGEAIEYLAKMFVAPSDRSFGRLALKEFGPASGIIDVYPLEVIEHVLVKYPGFLPKVGFGRFFRNLPEGETRTIFTDTATPVVLEYPEDLKVRGFALAGGGRPGYTFEPDLEVGKYRLHIQTSGRYTLLVSALNRGGYTLIDRLSIKVRARAVKDLGLPEEASYYPPRSEEMVRAWPVPVPRPISPEEMIAEGARAAEQSALTTGERIAFTHRDAVKGRESRFAGGDAGDVPLPSLELPFEDAELLRMAVEAVLGEAEQLATDAEIEGPQDPFETTARIEMPSFEEPDESAEITGKIEYDEDEPSREEQTDDLEEIDDSESGDFDR